MFCSTWDPPGSGIRHLKLSLIKPRGVISMGSRELCYHSPLGLSSEKKSAKAKGIDKKGFIRLGQL